MAAIFRPSANVWARAILVSAPALLVAAVIFWWVGQRTDWARGTDVFIDQPVPFSHQHHVAGLGIGCLMCHATVEVAANAGLPPTHTCMTCHSQIWTNAALLAPVRESLADNRPIAWNRVNQVPDYVYFNHSIHIAKGVGCSECHGNVAEMPLMYKAASMTMQWCLECHRNPGPRLRPAGEIFNTAWQRGLDTPSPEALLAQYHIAGRNLTECSICHR
ncbi:MAG: cytochrome c3 family protein [Acetobacteraceae bacterium]|nr:cytochrome c3 family protein [Acetobacteraceae bacterium]